MSFSLGRAGTLMTLIGALALVAGCPQTTPPPATSGCTTDADCSGDTSVCFTAEGAESGTCVACISDTDCDDGTFCNGAESCGDDNTCGAGTAECTGDNEVCDEDGNACRTTCSDDAGCDDDSLCTTDSCGEADADGVRVCVNAAVECEDNGVFCDGAESCDEATGDCASEGDPCAADEDCNEDGGTCDTAPAGLAATADCPDSVSEGGVALLTGGSTGEAGDVTFAWSISSGNGTFDDDMSATTNLTNTAIGTMEVTVTATDTCVGCDDNGTPDDDTDDLDTTETTSASCSIAVVPETLTVELGPDRIFTNDSRGAGNAFNFTLAVFSDDNDGAGEANEFPQDINCVAADTGGADLEVRTEWTVVAVPMGMSTSNVVLLAPLNTGDLRARINPSSTSTIKTLRGNGTEATSAQGRVIPGVYTFGCNATTDTDPIGVSETINITLGDPFATVPDGVNDVAAVTPATGTVTHQTTVTDSTTVNFAIKSIIAGTLQWLLDDQDKADTFDVLLNTTTVAGDGNEGDATTGAVAVTSPARGSYDLAARFTDATGTGDADTAKANTAVDIHVTTPFNGNVVDLQISTSTISGFGLVNSNTAGARVHGARKFNDLSTTTTAATTVGGTTVPLTAVTGLGVDSLLIFDEPGNNNGPAYHRVTAINTLTVTVTPAFTAIHASGEDVDTPGALYEGTAVVCCDINNDGFNELITGNGSTVTIFGAVNTNVAATDNTDSPVDNSVWHRGALVSSGGSTATQVDEIGLDTNDPVLDRWTITGANISDIVCCDLNNDGWMDLAFGDPLFDETNTDDSGRVLVYYNEANATDNEFEDNPFNTAGALVSGGIGVAVLAPDATFNRLDGTDNDDARHFGHRLCCANVNGDTNSIDDLVISAPTDGADLADGGNIAAIFPDDVANAIGATTLNLDATSGAGGADVTVANMVAAGFISGAMFRVSTAGVEYYKVSATPTVDGQLPITPPIYTTATATNSTETLGVVSSGVYNGRVYVMTGLDNSKYTGTTTIQDNGTNASAMITAPGGLPGDLFGADIACGDFTGDGVADIVIGSPGRTNNATPGLTNAGAVWVVNGGTAVSGLSVAPNSRYEGQGTYLGLGRSVGLADMNANGTMDIVAGAVNGGNDLDNLAATVGRVYIIPNGTSQILGTSTAGTLDALPKISGAAADSILGARITTGDFSSDGSANFVAVAPAFTNANHQVMMFTANSTLPTTMVPTVTFDNTDTSAPVGFLSALAVLTGGGAGETDVFEVMTEAYISGPQDGCVICDIDGDGANDLFWQGLDAGALGEAFLILGWTDDTP